MPPVLGPSSLSKIRLKSWARGQCHGVVAVAEDEQGNFGAVQELLDDHCSAGVEAGLRVGQGLVAVLGDHNALAGGQAVVLHHVRCAERVQGIGGFVGVCEATRAIAVGTSASAMTCLANALDASSWAAALPGRTRGCRWRGRASETPAARGASGPTTTRSTPSRWPAPSRRRGRLRVDRVRRDQLADAGVAGGSVDLGYDRVSQQGADNGVFAASGANDENLHSHQGYLCTT